MSDHPGAGDGPADAGEMFVERLAFDAWLAAIVEAQFDAAEASSRIEDGRQQEMFDDG